MATVGRRASALAKEKLVGPSGMSAAVQVISDVSGIHLPSFDPEQVNTQNVAMEIIEQSKVTKYPAICLYCEKVTNRLREKFRTFSGEVNMVIEVRVSQDRIDGLDTNAQLYAEAALRVLDENRGDWGHGVLFNGGYEVSFGAIKRGGRNFVKSAKITFVLDVSEG